MFSTTYIDFSFKLDNNDTIKKCVVVTNYYSKNEVIVDELKRKIEFCLDRYSKDFYLSELDYSQLMICHYKMIAKTEMQQQFYYDLFICCNNDNFQDDYFIYNGNKLFFSRERNKKMDMAT